MWSRKRVFFPPAVAGRVRASRTQVASLLEQSDMSPSFPLLYVWRPLVM